MASWMVSKSESGMSLQAYLKLQFGDAISAKRIKRALDAGRCLLNGQVERFGTRFVGTGDKIECEEISLEAKPTTQEGHSRVLYIDDDLIAYNKAPGMASDSKELTEELRKQFKEVTLLHRLDKETSGILLFARNEKAAKAIEELFRKREILKTYLALVDGIPSKPSGVIENYLGKLKVYEGQTLWGEVPPSDGLRAKTKWQLKSSGKTAALLVCFPETGRTHQIRVHLSGMGHPILGDYQYGKRFLCKEKAPRIMLHASEASFKHPNTRKKINLTAPLPDDFVKMLERLER